MARLTICAACLRCVRFLDAEVSRTAQSIPILDHHYSVESFEAAVENSCLICNYLASVWSLSTDVLDFSSRCECYGLQDGRLRIHFNQPGREPVLVYLVMTDDKPTLQRYCEELIPPHTSHERVLKVARKWLDYCRTNHPECIKHDAERKYYPSRLVDLLPQGMSGSASWSLIDDTSNLTGGYATLSHRWGRGNLEPFKLTQSSYNDMVKGLPDSCLSGTYCDAIRVVRELGLRYIWIDSLCVPQDPGTLDIQIAAFRMAEIYGHSSCNIAALTARQDTIFSTRDAKLYSPSAAMLPASVYALNQSYTVLLAKQWDRSVMETPLSRRAWILREQLLPKRLLYFGEGQMLWSCSEGAFCELYPLDDTTCDWLEEGMFEGDIGSLRSCLSDVEVPNFSAAEHQQNSEAAGDNDNDNLPGPDVDWMDLLMLYGQRDLSFAEDKLLAIAGISELLTSYRKHGLMAGLLVKDLPRNLLWIMDHTTARVQGYSDIRMSPVQRAPSWSWAYYDGPISYYSGPSATSYNYERAVARVRTIRTQTTLIDKMKVFRGGDLHLFAASLPLERYMSTLPGAGTGLTSWFMPFVSALPSSPQYSGMNKGLKLTCNRLDGTDSDSWDDQYDGTILFDLVDYLNLDGSMTAIFITASVSKSDHDNERLSRFDGLVLHQHPQRDRGVYERLGIFAVVVKSSSPDGPDVPMTRLWHFDDHSTEDGINDPRSAKYDFDSASFMQEFIIG